MKVYLEPTENYVFNGKITINGTFDDYVIGGTDKIYFSSSRDDIVFIQTDKPLYKEGQTGNKIIFFSLFINVNKYRNKRQIFQSTINYELLNHTITL